MLVSPELPVPPVGKELRSTTSIPPPFESLCGSPLEIAGKSTGLHQECHYDGEEGGA